MTVRLARVKTDFEKEVTMNELIELNDKLLSLPSGVLVAFLSIALGYVLKSGAFFPNNRIPFVVVLISSVAFPTMQCCAYAAKGDYALYLWIPKNIVIGVIIGFMAWTFHAQILKRWVDPHFFNDDSKK